MNTAFPGGDDTDLDDGWFEVNTEGLANIYLTITDEGIITASTDTPASKEYKARVSNADQFSIKRRPLVWPWGNTNVQLAAYGQLQLDNYDGFFAYLVGADLRDTVITIKLPAAMALGTATLIADAPLMCTAILDNVTCDTEDVITISMKDTIGRLDKQLPVKINPPFVDSGAANRMVPLSLGAVRNRAPLLIDGPNLIYQLGDSNISNLVAVRDRAAPLDFNATPPQVTPALSGSGMQLATGPVDFPGGKLTADFSNVGTQVVIPGVSDVLAGAGDFLSWSGSPAVPVGFTWSNNALSDIDELTSADGYRLDSGDGHIARLSSGITWAPSAGKYGDQLTTSTNILKAGKAYRITFKVYLTFGAPPYYGDAGLIGGLMLRTALSNNPEDAITGHGQTITVPLNGSRQSYVYSFRVPAGSDRPLIFIAVASQGGPNLGTPTGLGGGLIYDVKLELLGEFLELPLEAMTPSQLFYEVLVARAGEDESVYADADLVALTTDTGYSGIGYAADEPPNILQVLREVLDAYGATMFTDNEGVVRIGRLIDPKTGTPIADFGEANVLRPISFIADEASNLTTVIGTTRNWSPYQDSDFVSDTDTVPASVRTRFKKVSQYTATSSKSPAGHYDFARNAPIFHSLLDETADGQTEIDRIVGIWSPQVYDDGTVTTGKRRFVTFTATFDDPEAIGLTVQCAVTDIGFGDVVTLDYPRQGFSNTAVEVVGWEIFPFSRRVTITGFCT